MFDFHIARTPGETMKIPHPPFTLTRRWANAIGGGVEKKINTRKRLENSPLNFQEFRYAVNFFSMVLQIRPGCARFPFVGFFLKKNVFPDLFGQ
jgi:hypothetical protein